MFDKKNFYNPTILIKPFLPENEDDDDDGRFVRFTQPKLFFSIFFLPKAKNDNVYHNQTINHLKSSSIASYY